MATLLVRRGKILMPDYLKSILEFLKLAPRYLIALGIMAAILLFSPDQFLKTLGLDQFTEDYRTWLGLTLIVTGVLWGVSMSSDGLKRIRRKQGRKKIESHIIERLKSLTEDEKQILRFYILHQTKTNVLHIDDGVVQGLVSSRIIYQSASAGNLLEGFAHNISKVAWEFLNENQSVLMGDTNIASAIESDGLFFKSIVCHK